MADEEEKPAKVWKYPNVPVCVIGDTGEGKSTMFGEDKVCGIKGLPPERTFIANAEDQPLPFMNASQFKDARIKSNKALHKTLDWLATPAADKYDFVVLDSMSACLELVETYTNHAFTNFDVWNNYNEITKQIMKKLKGLKQQVFVICHPEQKAENFGEMKSYAKIKGRELKYGYIEKQFIVVMHTKPIYDEGEGFVESVELVYRGNKWNTAKSPTGMFTGTVKNDALDVVKAIRKFYGPTIKEEATPGTAT